ncbi:hypothetical protein D3C75_538070 [compost metagenome]
MAPPYLARFFPSEAVVTVLGHGIFGRTSVTASPAASTLTPNNPSDEDQIAASASGLF